MLEVNLFLLCYRIDNEQTSFTRKHTVEDTHTIKNITPIVLRPFFKNNRKITFEGYILIINGVVSYFFHTLVSYFFCFHARTGRIKCQSRQQAQKEDLTPYF
jgi:hypothetical protein